MAHGYNLILGKVEIIHMPPGILIGLGKLHDIVHAEFQVSRNANHLHEFINIIAAERDSDHSQESCIAQFGYIFHHTGKGATSCAPLIAFLGRTVKRDSEAGGRTTAKTLNIRIGERIGVRIDRNDHATIQQMIVDLPKVGMQHTLAACQNCVEHPGLYGFVRNPVPLLCSHLAAVAHLLRGQVDIAHLTVQRAARRQLIKGRYGDLHASPYLLVLIREQVRVLFHRIILLF